MFFRTRIRSSDNDGGSKERLVENNNLESIEFGTGLQVVSVLVVWFLMLLVCCQTLKCSECQESVSELLGHWYLFTSLGEKEKRFVCKTCIDAIKKRIATAPSSPAAAGLSSSSSSVMQASPTSPNSTRKHPLPPHLRPRYSEVLEEHLESERHRKNVWDEIVFFVLKLFRCRFVGRHV